MRDLVMGSFRPRFQETGIQCELAHATQQIGAAFSLFSLKTLCEEDAKELAQILHDHFCERISLHRVTATALLLAFLRKHAEPFLGRLLQQLCH